MKSKNFRAIISSLLAVVLLCTSVFPAFATEQVNQSPELITNGSFDTDEIIGWKDVKDGNKVYIPPVIEEKDGERYLKYAYGVGLYNKGALRVDNLEKNTDYKLSLKYICSPDFEKGDIGFDGKEKPNGCALKFWVIDADKNTKLTSDAVLQKGGNDTWATYEAEFNTGDGTDIQLWLQVGPTGENASLLIDDVSLKEVVPLSAPVITMDSYETTVSDGTTTSLSGSVDCDCEVSYTVNGGSAVALETAENKFTTGDIDLAFGENTIVITADNFHQTTETIVINRTYEIPVEAPVITLYSTCEKVYQSTYYLVGSVDKNAEVKYTLNGEEVTLEVKDGLFFNELKLVAGDNVLNVKAYANENGKVHDDVYDEEIVDINYDTNGYVTNNLNVWDWDNVEINGMGWVTGAVISKTAPYQMYCKTDVGGAYRFNRDTQKWEAMTDFFGTDERNAYNIESIAVDPNDGNTVYIACNGVTTSGKIFVSHNGGRTWESMGLEKDCPGTFMDANDNKVDGKNRSYRTMTGERLTVDPNNSDILYFGSRTTGLYRYDGESWSRVDGGLPQSTSANAGFPFVVYDYNGGTIEVDGKTVTKTLYTGIFDQDEDSKKVGTPTAENGMYRSDDGGQTWVKLEGCQDPQKATVNDNGTLYVTSNVGLKGSVWMLNRGEDTLKNVAQTNNNFGGLTVGIDGVSVIVTDNKAPSSTWYFENGTEEFKTIEQTIGKKMAFTEDWCHESRGTVLVDYSDPTGNTMFSTTGFGVITTDEFFTAETPVWDDITLGIDELVVNSVRVPPVDDGYDLHIAAWDMGGFSIEDKEVVPEYRLLEKNVSTVFPEWGTPLTQITCMEYSFMYPKYMAYVGYHEFGYNSDKAFKFGTTTDGGKNWTESSTILPTGESGGSIAMSAENPYNLVWAPARKPGSAGSVMKYSFDFGKTWKESEFPLEFAYEKNNIGWGAAVNLAADRVNGDVFYFFTEKDMVTAQFYMSTDGGATWNLTYEGHTCTTGAPEFVTDEFDAAYLPYTNVRVNPVKEGDVFLAVKPYGVVKPDGESIVYEYKQLWRSTDSTCTDFDVVEGVDYAVDVAFGKGDTIDTPYIYILGSANGDDTNGVYEEGDESGIYVSKDNGKTWEKISDSSKQFGKVRGIEADMREKNIVYVATSGRGVIYGKGEEDTTPDFDYGCKDVYEGELPEVETSEEEIVFNGDFEGETVSPWFTFKNQATLTIDKDVKYEGESSLKVTGRQLHFDGIAQIVPDANKKFIANEKYEMSVQVKLPDGAPGATMGLYYAVQYAGEEKLGKGLQVAKEVVEGSDWIEISGTFTPEKDVEKVQIYLREEYGSTNEAVIVDVYLDEFKIVKNSEAQDPVYDVEEENSVKAQSEIVVDGKIDEDAWNGEFIDIKKLLHDDYNNTAKFSTVWTEDGLYIAVVVEDDVFIQEDGKPHLDDAIEIYIDPENDKATSYGANDYQLVTRNGLDDVNITQSGKSKLDALPNLEYKSSKDGDNYYFEYFVKWSDLGITEVSKDMKIGFDIINIDEDVSGTLNKASWSGDDGNWMSTTLYGNLTLVEEAVVAPEPPVLEQGDGQKVEEDKDATFKSSAEMADFIEVRIDGVVLDPKNYTVTEGSTIITLKADYLATLKAGDYTIEIVSKTGTVDGTFTVPEKTTAPETGDSNTMLIVLSIIATMAGATLLVLKKRVR